MDVSIVIPTKNAGKSFKHVLEMIFMQNTDFSYEVICVDSGSCDETINIINQFPVKLIKIAPSEFGHGKTRNLGAKNGTGEFIIFITQDALPVDNLWLDNFIKTMKNDPEIAGGFGRHIPYPNCNIFDKRDIERHFEGFGENGTIFFLEDKDRYNKDEGYRHMLAFFSDNNSCIRRSVWEKIPYDDVQFAEDQLWAKKIIELGYKKIYCKNCPVYHSHNFPLFTYFKRYFDEYKGLYQVYQYKACDNIFKMISLIAWIFYNDLKFVIELKDLSIIKKFYWAYYSLIRNFFRFRAAYLAVTYFNYDNEKQVEMDKHYSQQLIKKN